MGDAERLREQLLRVTRREEALEIAIQAAEASMRALKLSKDPREKTRHSKQFQALIQGAERIKHDDDWRTGLREIALQSNQQQSQQTSHVVSHTQQYKLPTSTRLVPIAEQILLLKAGFLNGYKFPPWEKEPSPSDFELQDGHALYTDTPELPLSELQESIFDGWKRPKDALPPPAWPATAGTSLGPSMQSPRRIDLVQDAATDCSVVASLCACVARAERGHANIFRNIFYPYDVEHDCQSMSANGKYIVCLNFNGCFRKVIIDDRLPVSRTTQIIHVIDRNNRGLLWPALLEKAYLKVRGGYDFPGSNSATDLWVLTGWIPEQVFLQSDQLELDHFWRRVKDALDAGDVVITLGTGKMTSKTERELGLVAEHDYACLDLREADGQRLFLIKNPWCEASSCTPSLIQGLNSPTWPGADAVRQSPDESNSGHPLSADPLALPHGDMQSPSGTFWMSLERVMQHFESIYLNWNPGLFAYREELHFSWNLSPVSQSGRILRGQHASLSRHPQMSVTTTKKSTVWLLLSRHFKNSIPEDATDEEIEEGRDMIDLRGHISIAAFASQGRRVLVPEKPVAKSWFVDSPQTLLKLESCIPGQAYTIVPLEQELAAVEHTFTLSCFSNSPLQLTHAGPRFPHSTTLSASWTKDTAGGNAHSLRYCTNPQFAITISRKTDMSLLLETTNQDLNVHIKFAHGQSQRHHAIRNRDIIFDSGDYRRGHCLAEHTELEPGQYIVICSTFEPDQLGEFTLLIDSSHPSHAVLLPKEGAGRIRVDLGTVAFQTDQTRLAIPIVPKRLVKAYAVARYLGAGSSLSGNAAPPSSRSLACLSIESGRGPNQRVHTASNEGEYADCGGGLRTADLDLSPEFRMRVGEFWLVLDRMSGGMEAPEERFTVEVFVDQQDGIVGGSWRAWEE